MSVPAIASIAANGTTPTDAAKAKADGTASADRFLKLLVAQMKNQDPLNPMDNAQVTSQMAQINTVNGIEKLNTTMQSMSTQMMQSQVLQGASLVGHDVVVPGNHMSFDDDAGAGAFELKSSADSVQVDVVGADGSVKDTIDMGKLEAGTHQFDWPGDANTAKQGATFRITAKLATGDPVGATALMRDRVNAISTQGDSMTLDLENSGKTPYSDVRELN
jgi:flagellar basal-body rod modification protein FlgD